MGAQSSTPVSTDKFYNLINQFSNYYEDLATEIHDLTREDTAPIFPDVWKKVEPIIEGLPLVAHNKLLPAPDRCSCLWL